MCTSVCVCVCVCVCMYILLNIYCLKGVWGVGELTAVCVWSCFILIWCTCTELLSCTVLFKGASLTTGAFCLSVATFFLTSNLWKGKKRFFFFLKKEGKKKKCILVADCDLLQAVMPVISVILYILHLYMKVIQVSWFDQYFLPTISLSAF